MGKKTAFGIGTVVMGVGLIGVFNALLSFGKAPADKKDLAATGTVTRLHGSQLKHQLTGVTISTQYQFDYKFVAADGEVYTDTETVNEEQFNSLREGQPIVVLYHSNQPSISAAKDYGHYISVKQMPSSTPKQRLYFCIGICVFGGCFLAVGFFGKDDKVEVAAAGINSLDVTKAAAMPKAQSDQLSSEYDPVAEYRRLMEQTLMR